MATQGADMALALARKAFKRNDLARAETLFRQVLQARPREQGALYGLGTVAYRAGRAGEAVRLIRSALEHGAGGNPEVHITLGMAHLAQGEYQQAATAVEKGIELAPDAARGYQALGEILARAGEYRKAYGAYTRALERNPGAVELLFGQGHALFQLGFYGNAREVLGQALRQRPDLARVRLFLARAQLLSTHEAEAAEHFRELEALPEYRPLARVSRGVCALFRQRPEETLALLEALDEASLDGPLRRYASSVRASALAALGRTEEAAALCRRVLGEDAGMVDAWMVLGEMPNVSLEDDEFATLERLVDEGPLDNRARLAFVRAWEYGRRGCWREEMAALHQANALHRQWQPHDPAQVQRSERRLLDVLDPDWFERYRGHGTDAVCPIFVVGMPRAGTTWTEQVLASHPEVGAAGESRAVGRALQHLCDTLGSAGDEDGLNAPPSQVIPAFVARYLEQIEGDCGGRYEYFVDTVKTGYRNMGLLAAAFPRARFILVSRDPMDICVDAYRKLFRTEQYFAYDLEHCAEALVSLDRTFAMQAERFPVPVHRLVFEELVADFDRTSRALFDFIGLSRQEGALALHEDFAECDTEGGEPRLSRAWLHRWTRYREDEQVAALAQWFREQGYRPGGEGGD